MLLQAFNAGFLFLRHLSSFTPARVSISAPSPLARNRQTCPSADQRCLTIVNIESMFYDEAERLQLRIVEAKNATLRESDNMLNFPDVLLLLEHPPTITIGSQGNNSHVLSSLPQIQADGITVHRADRGGKVTYHGPGQLVGYAILNIRQLASSSGDVGAFVKGLQQTVITTAAAFGISAVPRRGDELGVWVPDDSTVVDSIKQGSVNGRKLAAIGARLSRFTTYHGVCVNVTTNLDHYCHIIPCGLQWQQCDTNLAPAVTSIIQELKRQKRNDEIISPSNLILKARRFMISAFREVFQYRNDAVTEETLSELVQRLERFESNIKSRYK